MAPSSQSIDNFSNNQNNSSQCFGQTSPSGYLPSINSWLLPFDGNVTLETFEQFYYTNFPSHQHLLIKEFLSVIEECHSGQKRKNGQPYFNDHLLPVAMMVVTALQKIIEAEEAEGSLKGEEVTNTTVALLKKYLLTAFLAAIGHDVLEDTATTPSRLVNHLFEKIPQTETETETDTMPLLEEVVRWIAKLTKRPKGHYPEESSGLINDTAFLVAGIMPDSQLKSQSSDVAKGSPDEEALNVAKAILALIKLVDNCHNLASDVAGHDSCVNPKAMIYLQGRVPYYLRLAEAISKVFPSSYLPDLYKILVNKRFEQIEQDFIDWINSPEVGGVSHAFTRIIAERKRDPARFTPLEQLKQIIDKLQPFASTITITSTSNTNQESPTPNNLPNAISLIYNKLLTSLEEAVIEKQLREPKKFLTPSSFIDEVTLKFRELKTITEQGNSNTNSSSSYNSEFYSKLVTLVSLLLADGNRLVISQLSDWIKDTVKPLAEIFDRLILLEKLEMNLSDEDLNLISESIENLQGEKFTSLINRLETFCKEKFAGYSGFYSKVLKSDRGRLVGPMGVLQLLMLSGDTYPSQFFIDPNVIKKFQAQLRQLIIERELPLLKTAGDILDEICGPSWRQNAVITYTAIYSGGEQVKLEMSDLVVNEEVTKHELKAVATYWTVEASDVNSTPIQLIARQRCSPESYLVYLAQQVSGEKSGTLGMGTGSPPNSPEITIAGATLPDTVEEFVSRLGKVPLDPLRPGAGCVYLVSSSHITTSPVLVIVQPGEFGVDLATLLPVNQIAEWAKQREESVKTLPPLASEFFQFLKSLLDLNSPYFIQGARFNGSSFEVDDSWRGQSSTI